MCGIAGIILFDDKKVNREKLIEATDVLKHRGPDAGDVYIDNESIPRVGLGHRRLAIIDLSESANQPMTNENKDVWIVFNGEIYNFQNLRAQLGHGHSFVSNSDTEVIVHLYEQYGEDAISMLDGMFAFAIYDKKARKIIIARDRTGKKPVYYYKDSHKLIFGSEIKAVLKFLERHEIIMNEHAIPSYLVYGYTMPAQTFYKGIYRLDPAHYMVNKQNGSLVIKEYWSLKSRINDVSSNPVPALKDDPMLRLKLADAVKKRLISDVPLGAFLSGGVDSSIVTGIMSKFMNEPVKTFSIGFSEDPDYDETAYAHIVAKRFLTDHHSFVVTPSAIDLIDKLLYHYDEPFGDASAIPTYIVSQLTRRYVTVALNGDGGDELFAGYQRFIAGSMSESMPGLLRSMFYDFSFLIPAQKRERAIPSRIKRFLKELKYPFIQRYLDWISYIRLDAINTFVKPELLYRDYKEEILSYFDSHIKGIEHASPLTQLLYINFKTYLPDDLLIKMDRMAMANSLESRSPFLDTGLIEYAFTLPDKLKLNFIKAKYVLKHTFKDILPRQIQHRRKMGFGVPLGAWFRGRLKDYAAGYLNSDTSEVYNYLNREAVNRLYEEHQKGMADHGLKLWLILTLELWLRTLKKGSEI